MISKHCANVSRPGAARASPVALRWAPAIVGAVMEPGLVTLAKIIGTLLLAMGTIPALFLLAPGDRTEPTDRLDSEHKE